MKTLLLAMVAAFLSMGLFAQQPLSENHFSFIKENQTGHPVQPYPGVFSTNETIWVQDSSYFYLGDSHNDDGWILRSRSVVTQRDSSGNAVNSLFDFYDDATEAWSKAINMTSTYFQNNKEHTRLESPWNSDTQTWNDTLVYLIFNEDGALLLQVDKSWDFSNNHFTNGNKRVYNMVADSSYYDLTSYSLNMNTNLWELTFNERHYFNENHKDTLIVQRSWSSYSNEWLNIAKFFYTYDNGQKVTSLTMDWDSYLNIWVNERNTQYSYNTNGAVVLRLDKLWNTDSATWENLQQYNYYYNDAGNLDSLISMEWNSEQELWENYSRQIISRENDGNNTITLQQYWNGDTQQWENNSQTDIVNEAGINTEYTRQVWNNETEDWKNNAKYEFYWSEIEVHGIDEETANNITLYPNPANETISVLTPPSLSNNILSIYTLNGQLIKTVALNSIFSTIDISNIPSGLYFARFSTNHGIITKRFIKR